MKQQESKRIKLIETIRKDNTKISVGHTADIFCGVLNMFFEKTETGKQVKRKLNHDEYVCLITGFANTFLSSLYVSASISQDDLKKRIDIINDANSDVLIKEECDA